MVIYLFVGGACYETDGTGGAFARDITARRACVVQFPKRGGKKFVCVLCYTHAELVTCTVAGRVHRNARPTHANARERTGKGRSDGAGAVTDAAKNAVENAVEKLSRTRSKT